MDGVSQAVVSRARRGLALAALLLAVLPGCVGPDQFVPGLGDKAAPPPVAQLVAIWSNQVMPGIDPTHNGAPMVGLAGRVFLFGPEQKDYLLADGKLTVELYTTLPEQPQTPPVRLEVWEIDKATLNSKCLRKDGLGQGYTLNLPWPSYRPEIAQVQLRLHYEPEKGPAVIHQSLLTLNSGAAATPAYSNRVENGNRQVIATMPPPGPLQQTGGFQPAAQQQQQGQPAHFEMPVPLNGGLRR